MQDHPLPVSLAPFDRGGTTKRCLTILQRELPEAHLSLWSQEDSSEAQTVGLAMYECKWVQFVALTAISLERVWSLHHKWSNSTHQISLTGCETNVRIVHFCGFFQGLCGRPGTSTNRRAINCERRSDRWTDGFSILLSLPVHLQLMKWGEEWEKRWGEMICVNALHRIAPSPEHTNEAQWREQCQSN